MRALIATILGIIISVKGFGLLVSWGIGAAQANPAPVDLIVKGQVYTGVKPVRTGFKVNPFTQAAQAEADAKQVATQAALLADSRAKAAAALRAEVATRPGERVVGLASAHAQATGISTRLTRKGPMGGIAFPTPIPGN